MDNTGSVKQIFRRGLPKVPTPNPLYGYNVKDFIRFLNIVFHFTMGRRECPTDLLIDTPVLLPLYIVRFIVSIK